MTWIKEEIQPVIKRGDMVVMPTDTIYGIVGDALSVPVVNHIYTTRKRNPEKPCIILISDLADLKKFDITLSPPQIKKLREFWALDVSTNPPKGPTSIILDCPGNTFSYLHRGTNTLAFRIPSMLSLRELLEETGPLIAPSANPEGLPPAKNINEAREYFGEEIALYVDGGEITGKASKVIQLNKDGSVVIIRD